VRSKLNQQTEESPPHGAEPTLPAPAVIRFHRSAPIDREPARSSTGAPPSMCKQTNCGPGFRGQAHRAAPALSRIDVVRTDSPRAKRGNNWWNPTSGRVSVVSGRRSPPGGRAPPPAMASLRLRYRGSAARSARRPPPARVRCWDNIPSSGCEARWAARRAARGSEKPARLFPTWRTFPKTVTRNRRADLGPPHSCVSRVETTIAFSRPILSGKPLLCDWG